MKLPAKQNPQLKWSSSRLKTHLRLTLSLQTKQRVVTLTSIRSKTFSIPNDVAVRFPYGSGSGVALGFLLCVQWVWDSGSFGSWIFRRKIRIQRRCLGGPRWQRGNLLFCPCSPQLHLPHRQWRLLHSVIQWFCAQLFFIMWLLG